MSRLESDVRRYGLTIGTPTLGSVGPIAFGPEGILFAADNLRARIIAVDVGDSSLNAAPPSVEDLDSRLAAFLGCAREDVSIRDLAIHPRSRAAYLAIVRGAGATAVPLVIAVGSDGSLSEVSLTHVPFSQVELTDAPAAGDARLDARVLGPGEPGGEEMTFHGVTIRVERDSLRMSTVTDLAYVDGMLLVAGASNEEFASTLRRIPFPFQGRIAASWLEIFHVSHGKWETESPIRTFVPYEDGASLLASYTCTPVVHFGIADVLEANRVVGRTVADLGFMNTPLDMVSYCHNDEEYLLVANTRHPLIRIACRDIDAQQPLTTPTEPIGVPREELPHVGVRKMAALDDHVLMLQYDESAFHLRSYNVATL
jgi:hypothetical protein